MHLSKGWTERTTTRSFLAMAKPFCVISCTSTESPLSPMSNTSLKQVFGEAMGILLPFLRILPCRLFAEAASSGYVLE